MVNDLIHSKRGKVILWVIILIILLAGIYAYTHRSSNKGNKNEIRPMVTIERMERKDMMKRIVLSGETVPKASVDISPKYAGRIASVKVDLGDKVQPGQVLLSQDTKDISLSIAANAAGSAQASAEAVESRSTYHAGTMKAQSDYDNALTTYQRYETLFNEGAVSRQDRDDKYRAMMELMLRFADQTEAVQVWGVTDTMSWRSQSYPLLFDRSMNPKPAFYAVLEAAGN